MIRIVIIFESTLLGRRGGGSREQGQGCRPARDTDSHFGIRRFVFKGVKGCILTDLNSVEMLDNILKLLFHFE